MTKERIKDLKLAASFVKSIETADHMINLEIQQLAQRIPGSAQPASNALTYARAWLGVRVGHFS